MVVTLIFVILVDFLAENSLVVQWNESLKLPIRHLLVQSQCVKYVIDIFQVSLLLNLRILKLQLNVLYWRFH